MTCVLFFFSMSGTEQEWKLAQSNMEIASSSLFTATNELCIASVKSKSASGEIWFYSNVFCTACFLID